MEGRPWGIEGRPWGMMEGRPWGIVAMVEMIKISLTHTWKDR